MAGKPRPLVLTPAQRSIAAANIGLAWKIARRLRHYAWWLDWPDLESLCCEALCRAVVAHETKGDRYALGTFVDWQARNLIQHADTYRKAACRTGRVVPLDDDLLGSDALADRYAPPDPETVAACEPLLAALDEPQAQALWLCCALELTPTEAGAWMGATESRVRTLVRQGVRRARKAMGVL